MRRLGNRPFNEEIERAPSTHPFLWNRARPEEPGSDVLLAARSNQGFLRRTSGTPRRGRRASGRPERLPSGRGIGAPTGRSRAALLTCADRCCSERIPAEPIWEIPADGCFSPHRASGPVQEREVLRKEATSMRNPEGKTALVAGAASGIGRATALALAGKACDWSSATRMNPNYAMWSPRSTASRAACWLAWWTCPTARRFSSSPSASMRSCPRRTFSSTGRGGLSDGDGT